MNCIPWGRWSQETHPWGFFLFCRFPVQKNPKSGGNKFRHLVQILRGGFSFPQGSWLGHMPNRKIPRGVLEACGVPNATGNGPDGGALRSGGSVLSARLSCRAVSNEIGKESETQCACLYTDTRTYNLPSKHAQTHRYMQTTHTHTNTYTKKHTNTHKQTHTHTYALSLAHTHWHTTQSLFLTLQYVFTQTRAQHNTFAHTNTHIHTRTHTRTMPTWVNHFLPPRPSLCPLQPQIYEWVMLCVWRSHVSHMTRSLPYEWVMSHVWRNHMTHTPCPLQPSHTHENGAKWLQHNMEGVL